MLDPQSPVVQVHGLVNRFGAQVVHDGLDMDVRSNEIFGERIEGWGLGAGVAVGAHVVGAQRVDGNEVNIGRALGENAGGGRDQEG